jgi:hypothetical protein
MTEEILIAGNIIGWTLAFIGWIWVAWLKVTLGSIEKELDWERTTAHIFSSH